MLIILIIKKIHQIKNKNDVVDLMEANFGFHDAHIDKIITKGDKTKILFEKSWGSQIEMTFEKYVSYRVEPYDTLATDWWGDGSLFSKMDFGFYVMVKMLIQLMTQKIVVYTFLVKKLVIEYFQLAIKVSYAETDNNHHTIHNSNFY